MSRLIKQQKGKQMDFFQCGRLAFILVCAAAAIEKKRKGKLFDDWIWPITAAIWCFGAMLK